jgi:hypothetical protein
MMPDDLKKPAGYAAMVAEAEAAVVAVKDPQLRAVAFEKILSTLLEGPADRHASSGHGRQPARKKTIGKHKGTPKQRHGPKGHVEGLVDDGFFKTQRTIAEVKAELANSGHHIPLTSLSGPLQTLVQERRLRRQKVSSGDGGTKSTFAYSDW